MITQHQFNKALEEVNQAFDKTFKRLAALEAEVQALKSSQEVKSNAKKTRPKTSKSRS